MAGGGSGVLVVGERLYLPYAPAVDPSRSQGEEGRLPLVLREPFHFELQEDICGETLIIAFIAADASVCIW